MAMRAMRLSVASWRMAPMPPGSPLARHPCPSAVSSAPPGGRYTCAPRVVAPTGPGRRPRRKAPRPQGAPSPASTQARACRRRPFRSHDAHRALQGLRRGCRWRRSREGFHGERRGDVVAHAPVAGQPRARAGVQEGARQAPTGCRRLRAPSAAAGCRRTGSARRRPGAGSRLRRPKSRRRPRRWPYLRRREHQSRLVEAAYLARQQAVGGEGDHAANRERRGILDRRFGGRSPRCTASGRMQGLRHRRQLDARAG